jgi:hypothetical protein
MSSNLLGGFCPEIRGARRRSNAKSGLSAVFLNLPLDNSPGRAYYPYGEQNGEHNTKENDPAAGSHP